MIGLFIYYWDWIIKSFELNENSKELIFKAFILLFSDFLVLYYDYIFDKYFSKFVRYI